MKLKPLVPACPAHSGGGCSLNGGLRPRSREPREARGPQRDRALPFRNESVLRQDIKSVLGPGGSPVSPNSSSGPVFPGRGGAGPRQLHQRARSRGEGGRPAAPRGVFKRIQRSREEPGHDPRRWWMFGVFKRRPQPVSPRPSATPASGRSRH